MKKLTAVLLSLVLILSLCSTAMLTVGAEETTAPTVWDGTANIKWYFDGKTLGEYEIKTAEDLAGLACLVNASATDAVYNGVYYDANYNVLGYRLSGKDGDYKDASKVYAPTAGDGSQVINGETFMYQTVKLAADIVLNDGDASTWATTAPANNWEPIGIGGLDINTGVWPYFDGTFDGNGHTISGLYYNGIENAYGGGLFGGVGGSTSVYIQNVTLTNFYINCQYVSGGLVARAQGNLAFENCHVNNGIITHETNGQQSGGLLGRANARDVSIENCSVDVEVAINSWGAGGLVGLVLSGNLDVKNTFVAGTVTATAGAGVLVGRSDNAKTFTVENFYSTATVTATAETDNVSGVIVAEVKNTAPTYAVTGFYYVDNFTGENVVGKDVEGITAVTLAQLTGDTAKTTLEGFDFETVWETVADGTPVINLRELPNEGGDEGGDDGSDQGSQGGTEDDGNDETEAPETNAPETNAPETNAPTTTEKSGCGSVIGFASIAMIVIGASACVFRKKEN